MWGQDREEGGGFASAFAQLAEKIGPGGGSATLSVDVEPADRAIDVTPSE